VLDALRQQLRPHGVVLTTVSETMEDFVELVERGATDLLLGRFGAEYPDADSYAHGLYRSRTGIVHHYFSSAEVDTLIEEGRRIRDPEARRARYASLERILLRDHAVIPLIWEQNDRFARPEIDGLDLRILPPVVPYERLRRR
jgi:ABC-type oligopeptide transport system substrate-binding subunit